MHDLAADVRDILRNECGAREPRAWNPGQIRELARRYKADGAGDVSARLIAYADSRRALHFAIERRDAARGPATPGAARAASSPSGGGRAKAPGGRQPKASRVWPDAEGGALGRCAFWVGRADLPAPEPWHSTTPPWLDRP
jgi:hypothetical protein